ncbi:piggyBac transposable element-derived protein 2-like [Phymastichus coffea]|uniref:piggyBac transposable element-derived protein 2-like n=1 Tax=Phymastichus coffea TaxID=108790 RepID=UPI00273C9749|nr:piggyBac transposable element-derived protein 2-like [Phymastichus coffea]
MGPFFIEGNLNAVSYEQLLRNQIVPAIQALRADDFGNTWFQQDGALVHYGVNVRQYLNETSFDRWIGRRDNLDVDSEENDEFVVIPDPNNSGSEGEYDSDDENLEEEIPKPNISYRSTFHNYSAVQKKLEPDHEFSWCNSEKVCPGNVENELLLSDSVKKKICSMSPVQLFELFFSKEIKNYIIEASEANGLDLSVQELNTFVGILLLSSYNIRNELREYWETDPLVKCSVVSSAMSRDRFCEIKTKIKYSKPKDKNDHDKAWKVREILNLFKTNIQQFGFFMTALSVDGMMVRFFGRTCLKRYLPCKPDRYGLKLWGLCGANGYLFNMDICCGKNDTSIGINLASCPLGSRVVVQMINPLLLGISKRKLLDYHLYFDNYFTSPDLIVHLGKYGLRSTGTVRKDRVKVKHTFEKKAPRGTFKVDHDTNSGMNFITVIDSKEVSVLSTAVGVTRIKPIKRYSRTAKDRI